MGVAAIEVDLEASHLLKAGHLSRVFQEGDFVSIDYGTSGEVFAGKIKSVVPLKDYQRTPNELLVLGR